jgi:hypothetical protein
MKYNTLGPYPNSFKHWSKEEQDSYKEEVERMEEDKERKKFDPNYGRGDHMFERWKKEQGIGGRGFLNALKKIFKKT